MNAPKTIAEELRAKCETLRYRPIPLDNLIPLMQRAADALDGGEAPKPAFHGFMDEENCCVHLCFTPSAPRHDGVYATAYYTTPAPTAPAGGEAPAEPCNKRTADRWLCSRQKGHAGPCDASATDAIAPTTKAADAQAGTADKGAAIASLEAAISRKGKTEHRHDDLAIPDRGQQ